MYIVPYLHVVKYSWTLNKPNFFEVLNAFEMCLIVPHYYKFWKLNIFYYESYRALYESSVIEWKC